MPRKRADTIGDLGRLPARPSAVSIPPPVTPPQLPAPPERGAIREWLHGAFFDNIGLKFLSIVLAITVFLLVSSDKNREMSIHIPVSYTLPDDRVLVSDRLDDVRVTVKGPQRLIRKLYDHAPDAINLDLRATPAGEVSITTDLIKLPAGLAVTDVSPRTVRVAWDKRTEKIVEIAPSVVGAPPHGYWVAEMKAQPTTAHVRGADRVIKALTSIRTKEINLNGHGESFTASTQLVPPEGVELVGSPDVAVAFQVDEQLVTRKFTEVPVTVRGDAADKWSAPGQVDVTLTGTLLAVERARTALTLTVRVSPTDKAVAHAADVVPEGLPPGVGVKLSPERVKLVPVVIRQ